MSRGTGNLGSNPSPYHGGSAGGNNKPQGSGGEDNLHTSPKGFGQSPAHVGLTATGGKIRGNSGRDPKPAMPKYDGA